MILMPVPDCDFEPSEASVPWKIMRDNGFRVKFATPSGRPGKADYRLLTGEGLGVLRPLLKANSETLKYYHTMTGEREFNNPLKYEDIDPADFEGLLLPGGHAPGMKPYLESKVLQEVVARFFKENRPVGAICHGVLLVARSVNRKTGKSVIYEYKTTSLLKLQELTAYYVTRLRLKDYFRTYPITVEDEVKSYLIDKRNFFRGNTGIMKDSMKNTRHGFTVQDRNYLSARWPGDVYRFSMDFIQLLNSR